MALVLVLVARTNSVPPRPPGWNSARSMRTTSGGGGAFVVTLSDPLAFPTPPQHALAAIVTVMFVLTAVVVTGKSAICLFLETTIDAGTCTMFGWLLVRNTCAASVTGALNLTLPVAGPPPPITMETE